MNTIEYMQDGVIHVQKVADVAMCGKRDTSWKRSPDWEKPLKWVTTLQMSTARRPNCPECLEAILDRFDVPDSKT